MANDSRHAQILGFGSAAPSIPLSNQHIEECIDTSAEWIEKNIGIKNRLVISDQEDTITMGVASARQATEAAVQKLASQGSQRSPREIYEKIRVLVCATNSPPELYPATGIKIQQQLGLTDCFAFDVQAGCTGWLYGLSIATNYVQNLADGEYALVVGTDALSTELDYHERIGILFGDGAGAALLGHGNEHSRVIDVHLGSEYSDSLYLKTTYHRHINNPTIYQQGGRPTMPEEHPQMAGKMIMKLTLEKLRCSLDTMLARNEVRPDEIDFFIPHQTNIHIVKKLCEHIDFPFDKVPITLDQRGSISTAGLPTHTVELMKTNNIEPGAKMLYCAYGAGFTYGSALIAY